MRFIFSSIFLIGIQTLLISNACATPPTDPSTKVTFRILAVTNPITGLFYDLNKKQIELSASPGMLSSIYTRPDGGRISIYKIVESPDKLSPPQRVIVAETNLEDGGPYLILLDIPDNASTIGLSVLDDSWTVHPANLIRVLNLSKRYIAVQLGQSHKEIKSGKSELFPKNGSTSIIKVKTAALEDGNWTLRAQLPQSIFPYSRQTFLIQDSNPSPENPTPMEINIYNIVDTSPEPKQPVNR